MFRQRVKHYHQWLHSSIHLKTKFSQSSTDSIRLQGPSKRPSSGLLYPVSSVKERNRKGGKCKISPVLQSPVSSIQASPKVEASNRLKQAQHLPTCRKIQNGNTRGHQDLSDSRGMGAVDRPIRPLPLHPHPPKLKEVPKVLPQVTGVPVHLPSLRASHSPAGLYNDYKRSEAVGPDKGNQTSSVPGRLAYQGPVSKRSTSEHSDSGRSDPVLRVDNKSGEIRTKVFLFVSYEHHLDSALVKPNQERWLKLLDYRNHFYTPRVVAESHKCDERCKPSSQRPQYPTLYRRHKRRQGRSLRAILYKGSVVRQGKKATHKFLELKVVSLVLQRFKDQCQNQTVLVATDNSTVVAYINKQGGTHSVEMCALLWKIMTWCHHYQITLKARHIPGCLNVMADLLSRSDHVQSTEWSLHLQVFKQIYHKWSEPQNSTVHISSPRLKFLGHRCSEHKLVGSHCLCLPYKLTRWN